MNARPTVLCTLILAAAGANAAAVVVPFTEHFNSGAANWAQADGSPAIWSPAGGPDGSGYISGSINFSNSVFNEPLAFLRGHAAQGASGGAFAGDWLASGVESFSFFIRHNGPVPIPIFTRFASPFNFPGGIALEVIPVQPDTWTQITIPIHPDNPQFITFEGSIFDAVFPNIGNIQFGVLAPRGLAGMDTTVTFDIDMVMIVPAPGSLALLGLAALAPRRRRR
jgi:hypothetical protein